MMIALSNVVVVVGAWQLLFVAINAIPSLRPQRTDDNAKSWQSEFIADNASYISLRLYNLVWCDLMGWCIRGRLMSIPPTLTIFIVVAHVNGVADDESKGYAPLAVRCLEDSMKRYCITRSMESMEKCRKRVRVLTLCHPLKQAYQF